MVELDRVELSSMVYKTIALTAVLQFHMHYFLSFSLRCRAILKSVRRDLTAGQSSGIRTHDILIPNQVRYQTALHFDGAVGRGRTINILNTNEAVSQLTYDSLWHRRKGSNLQKTESKSVASTNFATPVYSIKSGVGFLRPTPLNAEILNWLSISLPDDAGQRTDSKKCQIPH